MYAREMLFLSGNFDKRRLGEPWLVSVEYVAVCCFRHTC